MGFTMCPAFPSTDLDRTAAFWGRLGFVETARSEEFEYVIVRHPLGLELHFGLDKEFRPSENNACAYLRFSTSDEAVALYEEWATVMPTIPAPAITSYGMVEWSPT
jgi:hypothetical protein